jgi:CheY-like chemotaxis protein
VSILVVEDDQDIREMLHELLTDEGYTVFTANNGKEGLLKLQLMRRPCLILLDLMMPVMNGWEFLDAKGSNDIIASIPVIVTSAIADRNQALQVTEVVKKPIDLDALLRTIFKICKPAAGESKAC